MSDLLTKIAGWHNRASPDEARLFCPIGIDVDGLRSGAKCFVVGSKGAGKSAALRYIERNKAPNDVIIENSFSPPLLHSFCEQTAGRDLKGAELELLWTYFICSKVCNELSAKKLIGASSAFDLSSKYGLQNRRSIWSRLLRSLSQLGVSLKFKTVSAIDADLKVGLVGQIPQGADGTVYPWAVQADFAKQDAATAAVESGRRVFVFFDEIDVQFNQARKRQTFDTYLETVEALLTATYKLRNFFDGNSIQIYPIIAIRSDIYDYIENADKGGWRSHSVRLQYSSEEIREIIAFRLSQAIGSELPFSDAWRKAVADERSYSDKDSAYKQIERRSLNRPRDYVEFLKLAAAQELTLKQGRVRISRQAINQASQKYSEYFLQEFKDEFAFRYDFAERIVDVFKTLCPDGTRNQFTFEAFSSACQHRGIVGDTGYFVDLAKYLFSVSVFGVQTIDVVARPMNFRFLDSTLRFPVNFNDPSIRFGLHTGLLKALLNEV